MVQADPNRTGLPSSFELPCSDETPVDNENQNLIPNLLLFLLEFIWGDRLDWFFSADMAIYHTTGKSPRVPVVPDGFLSIGVERRKQSLQGRGRLSYVLWEENNIPPILTLEVVSQTYGNEYDDKMLIYANLGVLYYIIYNPDYWRRDRHQPLEVYKLVKGAYQLQIGEPFWMPEIGLGIGRFQQHLDGVISREILTWYDSTGSRYLSQAEQERRRAEQERQARLEAVSRLLRMGLSVEQVAEALSLSIEEVRSTSA
ncbi:Uma2 family endonuclease [Pseudanabaenaceae cyanobacterium LEGE 13415]|nr:Uma2 family endonuclease [Pseudanabaenaceae cyanobacterium LEGE 13415]